MAITMSYNTLNYVQKLFVNYKAQNNFINEYTDFKERMDYEALKAEYIAEQSENNFIMVRDSATTSLQILEKMILLKRLEHCDTFHVSATKIKKEYEAMKNPLWINKLVKSFQFETAFTKQKFNFSFNKDYDASVKLKLDRED
jgi:hypothetical protein